MGPACQATIGALVRLPTQVTCGDIIIQNGAWTGNNCAGEVPCLSVYSPLMEFFRRLELLSSNSIFDSRTNPHRLMWTWLIRRHHSSEGCAVRDNSPRYHTAAWQVLWWIDRYVCGTVVKADLHHAHPYRERIVRWPGPARPGPARPAGSSQRSLTLDCSPWITEKKLTRSWQLYSVNSIVQ